jgi:hypothetical protein
VEGGEAEDADSEDGGGGADEEEGFDAAEKWVVGFSDCEGIWGSGSGRCGGMWRGF